MSEDLKKISVEEFMKLCEKFGLNFSEMWIQRTIKKLEKEIEHG